MDKKQGFLNSKLGVISLLIILLVIFRLLILFFSRNLYDYEECARGNIAREIMRGTKIPFLNYQYSPHEGGSLVYSLFTIPFFLLFGESGITLKLASLLFSIASLTILFLLINNLFSRKSAIIASLLFIFAPPLYLVYDLKGLGDFSESIFFCFFIIFSFFSYISYEKEGKGHNKKFMWLVIFGFTAGFAIWFNLISLLVLELCILLWFIKDKLFFIKKDFLIFIIMLSIGALPLITHSAYFGSKPFEEITKNFMLNVREPYSIYSLTRLVNFVVADLPKSLGFSNSWDSISVLRFWQDYLYYFCFVISFIVILFFISKRIKAKSSNVTQRLINLIIVSYLLIFLINYIFSRYDVGPAGCFKCYRYFVNIYPFIFASLAIASDYLWKRKNKLAKIAAILIIVVPLTLSLTWSIKEIGSGIITRTDKEIYPTHCYYLFGRSLGWDRNINISNTISYCKQIDSRYEDECMQGLAFSAGYVHSTINETIQKCMIFNGPFRKECLIKVALTTGWGYSISDVSKKCEEMGTYSNYCYFGIGARSGFVYAHKDNLIYLECQKLKSDAQGYCYAGLGSCSYDPEDNIEYEPEVLSAQCEKIDKIEGKELCYKSVGECISHPHVSNPVRAISFCSRIRKEYRDYCYVGLGKNIYLTYKDFNLALEQCNRFLNTKMRDSCIIGIKNSINKNRNEIEPL